MIINCISSKGKNHEICQDASACWTNNKVTITVVSDGHSDPKCIFSNIGSRIAVESAVEVLSLELSKKSSDLRIREHGDEFISDLCEKIINMWKERTLLDIQTRGIEYNEDYYSKYGATIVIGVITSEYIVGMQIGDGKLYCIHKNGRISEPLPLDEKCVDNHTTSLSDLTPMDSLHYFYRSIGDVVGISVCTDGFTNCYTDEDACKEIRHIFSELDVGEQWYAETCRRIVNLTEKGNQDDVSVSMACNNDADYVLFEALSTNKLPKLNHNTPPSIYSKICVDGWMKSGQILVEDGMVLFDGVYYFDSRKHGNNAKGEFSRGVLKRGRIKLPSFSNNNQNYGVYPSNDGIFWLFKGDYTSGDYTKIDNHFLAIDSNGQEVRYSKPKKDQTETEKYENPKKKV